MFRVCEGEDYNLSVEFDSSPAPAILEWVVRSNDRRSQVSLREGERRRGYNVAKYYSVRDERYPDRYKADITFERLQALDMDANAQHTLKVGCRYIHDPRQPNNVVTKTSAKTVQTAREAKDREFSCQDEPISFKFNINCQCLSLPHTQILLKNWWSGLFAKF